MSAQEVSAARTIAERGVVLVGTAHGNNLSNLIRNPELRPLVGGVSTVTLGDEMARQMNNNSKVRQIAAACFAVRQGSSTVDASFAVALRVQVY
jgi:stage III sporulation protein SpoIIIAA